MSKEKKAPPVIWLQDEDDENHPECGEWYEGATWCEEAINDGDVKYIRADIHESAISESRQEVERLNRLADAITAAREAEVQRTLDAQGEMERYRAVLVECADLLQAAVRDGYWNKYEPLALQHAREALHPTQPIQAHSKSEYKRLSAQGVEVIPPAEGREK